MLFRNVEDSVSVGDSSSTVSVIGGARPLVAFDRALDDLDEVRDPESGGESEEMP